MKHFLQNLNTGATETADVPPRSVPRDGVLMSNQHPLISAGIERVLVDFGKANLIDKARQQVKKRNLVNKFLPTV